VQQAKDCHGGEARRIAELGSGPGLGLEALLAQFNEAQVWGIDLSPVMLSQVRKRNRSAIAAGRLTLIEGDTRALSASEPADIVMANHVLYFWHDPENELRQIRGFLRPGPTRSECRLQLGHTASHGLGRCASRPGHAGFGLKSVRRPVSQEVTSPSRSVACGSDRRAVLGSASHPLAYRLDDSFNAGKRRILERVGGG
jgi:SAM-dependent methyltransferase